MRVKTLKEVQEELDEAVAWQLVYKKITRCPQGTSLSDHLKKLMDRLPREPREEQS